MRVDDEKYILDEDGSRIGILFEAPDFGEVEDATAFRIEGKDVFDTISDVQNALNSAANLDKDENPGVDSRALSKAADELEGVADKVKEMVTETMNMTMTLAAKFEDASGFYLADWFAAGAKMNFGTVETMAGLFSAGEFERQLGHVVRNSFNYGSKVNYHDLLPSTAMDNGTMATAFHKWSVPHCKAFTDVLVKTENTKFFGFMAAMLAIDDLVDTPKLRQEVKESMAEALNKFASLSKKDRSGEVVGIPLDMSTLISGIKTRMKGDVVKTHPTLFTDIMIGLTEKGFFDSLSETQKGALNRESPDLLLQITSVVQSKKLLSKADIKQDSRQRITAGL